MNHGFRIKLTAFMFGIVGAFSTQIYLPSLPAIALGLNCDVGDAQLSISSYLLGFGLLQLLYGPLSDRFGRRKIGLAGLVIAVIGCLGASIANDIVELITWRAVQGAGLAACITLMRAIMRDAFEGSELARGMSHISLAFALSPALAPVVGGYIQDYLGWRANLIFMAIYVSLVLILVWWLLPETNQNPRKRGIRKVFRHYLSLARNKHFMRNLLTGGLALSGIMSYTSSSPALFQNQLGFSASAFGWITVLIAATMLISRGLNIWLLSRSNDLEKITRMGASLMLFGSILFSLMAFANCVSVLSLIVPMIFYILGTGILLPNLMADAFTPFSENLGAVSAFYGSLQMLIGFVIISIISSLYHHYHLAIALTLLIISVLCQLFLLRTKADDSN